MNQRKKILTDRKMPDSSEIAKYGNFDKVMGDYTLTKKILMKSTITWGIMGLAAIAVVGGILLYMNSQKSLAPSSKENVPAKASETAVAVEAFVQIPLKENRI